MMLLGKSIGAFADVPEGCLVANDISLLYDEHKEFPSLEFFG